MQADWEYIPMLDARPNGVKKFESSEAELLQQIIARQVADLLSNYGDVLDFKVYDVADVSKEIEASQDSKTFKYLSINSLQLLGGLELTIEQIPEYEGEYMDARQGLHCVTISEELDDDYITHQCYAIWDPEYDVESNRVIDMDECPLSMSTLQELYEALVVATFEFATTRDCNEIIYDTSQYPIPLVEPELTLIAINEGF